MSGSADRDLLAPGRAGGGDYLAHVLQASPFAICTFRPDGQMVTANQAAADLVGTTLDRLLLQNFRRLPSWVEAGILAVAERALDEGTEQAIETHTTSTYGRTFWVRCRFVPFDFEGDRQLLMAAEDISARKTAEANLRTLASSQSVLLREVNHRVSNNLAALLGIVHLESHRARTSSQPDFLRALNEIDCRIRSLSVVHSLLSSREWRPVRLGELCEKIVASALLSGDEETLRVREHGSVLLQPEDAHSLGLVLNELATNTSKYGHLGGPPRVEIDISRDAGNQVHLCYRDHGPGFPSAVLAREGGRLGVGMEVMHGIVEQTLDGRLELSNDGGARVQISFHCMGEGPENHE